MFKRDLERKRCIQINRIMPPQHLAKFQRWVIHYGCVHLGFVWATALGSTHSRFKSQGVKLRHVMDDVRSPLQNTHKVRLLLSDYWKNNWTAHPDGITQEMMNRILIQQNKHICLPTGTTHCPSELRSEYWLRFKNSTFSRSCLTEISGNLHFKLKASFKPLESCRYCSQL